MAYCKNCGAYVPDGHSKCLACGLDQNEDKGNQYNSGTATQADPREASRESTEKMRRRLEEQRKRQQEENRRWAEAERRRRQQAQEKERDEHCYQEEKAEWTDGIYRPERYRANKVLAALSYLPVCFLLPFLFAREDKFAIYHAKQGALLFAVTAAGEALGSIFGLGWIVTLFHLYWIAKGIGNANAGKTEPLPYIGDLLSK